MDTSHVYQGYNLKIWADKYAFPVEVKNGADWIRPKIVIVTSNYSIKEVFPDPSIHLPLLERFKEVNRTERYDAKKNALNILKAQKCGKPKITLKKRKFDAPKKAGKPPLFRQNAAGEIIVNKITQPDINVSLNNTNAVAVIDLIEDEMDCIEDHCTERCDECKESIINCRCYESSDEDRSDDLFDI